MSEIGGRCQNERNLLSKWADLEMLSGLMHLAPRDMPVRRPWLIVRFAEVTKVNSAVPMQLSHCGQGEADVAIRQGFWWLPYTQRRNNILYQL